MQYRAGVNRSGKKRGGATLEMLLAGLSEIKDQLGSELARERLKQALASPQSIAVARAAKLIARGEVSGFDAALVSAFDRMLENSAKNDPGCQAKQAIADALYKLDSREDAVFLRGIRHVQREASWGPPVDTAANLRAVCALGLVRRNHPAALLELGDLLADSESPARIGAAKALSYSENDNAVPLLRLRVLTGEADPQVLAECLASLAALDPEGSPELMERLLSSPESAVAETAALALGATRSPQAFDVLRRWWERSPEPELRRAALLAIATLRLDASFEFLLSLVEDAPGQTARDAVAALGIHRHDAAVRERVVRIAGAREDVELGPAVAEAFE
ncbi:MAG: HEAT repeat domain-containing protein [Candidatus Wallbacteria bacterium]|nr:HEAT repeat domain-containing protein [Candidatus Wallbacteria bacterium]